MPSFGGSAQRDKAESKRRLSLCFGRAQQGLVEKEKFVTPTLSSTTTSNVTNPLSDLANQFAYVTRDKIVDTSSLLLNLSDQMQVWVKGKGIHHSYSTANLNTSSSAALASTSQPYMVCHRITLLGRPHLPRIRSAESG